MFCTETKKVITRKKHNCVFCERQIPAGKQAMSWSCVDEGTMERNYSCLPCYHWSLDADLDNEFSPGIRMEDWYTKCPDCGHENNVHWTDFGQTLEMDCDEGCGGHYKREYGYELSEFGCFGEWINIKPHMPKNASHCGTESGD